MLVTPDPIVIFSKFGRPLKVLPFKVLILFPIVTF
jgi:hypothetical protein